MCPKAALFDYFVVTPKTFHFVEGFFFEEMMVQLSYFVFFEKRPGTCGSKASIRLENPFWIIVYFLVLHLKKHSLFLFNWNMTCTSGMRHFVHQQANLKFTFFYSETIVNYVPVS